MEDAFQLGDIFIIISNFLYNYSFDIFMNFAVFESDLKKQDMKICSTCCIRCTYAETFRFGTTICFDVPLIAIKRDKSTFLVVGFCQERDDALVLTPSPSRGFLREAPGYEYIMPVIRWDKR